jgi:hypothetical protein
MIEKFITLDELEQLLGYSDTRSTQNWCRKNKIQILKAGKKSYVLSNMIDIFFQKQLAGFFGATNNNCGAILDAIKKDNTVELAELVNAPATDNVKKKYVQKKEHSRAALDFLTNIKTA